MKKNTKAVDVRVDLDETHRLAGGYGALAAAQTPEALLRRSVMANLLWEGLFYQDGVSVVEQIKSLIPKVDPKTVSNIAIEARTQQKLRHVPLLIAREMARIPTHKGYVGALLPKIVLRVDEITEFMALYWETKKTPVSAQVKKGLAVCFDNFNAYQFAKYNRDTKVKLRDVLFLTHPHPSQDKEELFKQIAEDTLPTPDTWEVALSTGKNAKETWERLITEKKLGALAFLRNLRNMEEAKVDYMIIQRGFETINAKWLLPLNYFAAANHAPRWVSEIEQLMFKGFANQPKLPGYTIFIVDVSGSMGSNISEKSDFNRLDVASIMATMAKEVCEHVVIYATAGDDWRHTHQTALVPSMRGFGLAKEIVGMARNLGGGGIFTRQVLEYVKEREPKADRIIIFSDSQDCDRPDRKVPNPFAKYNYIVDVSAHNHGVAYKGLWTAEVSGWSEHFIPYIMALEGYGLQSEEEQ